MQDRRYMEELAETSDEAANYRTNGSERQDPLLPTTADLGRDRNFGGRLSVHS